MGKSKNFLISYNEEKNVGVLRVMVPLEIPLRNEFAEMTKQLLEMPADNILLDLTNINRVFSLFTGTIVDFHTECEKAGKKLIVVLNPKLAKLFETLSFDQVLNLRIKE